MHHYLDDEQVQNERARPRREVGTRRLVDEIILESRQIIQTGRQTVNFVMYPCWSADENHCALHVHICRGFNLHAFFTSLLFCNKIC